jgi:hypothetical protein
MTRRRSHTRTRRISGRTHWFLAVRKPWRGSLSKKLRRVVIAAFVLGVGIFFWYAAHRSDYSNPFILAIGSMCIGAFIYMVSARKGRRH